METIETIETRIRLAEKRYVMPRLHPENVGLTAEMWEVGGEPVSYEVACGAEYHGVEEGDDWGRKWGTAWFRISGKVPEGWNGKQVVALIDLSFELEEGFGREGLVWKDGKPVIGVSRNRKAVPLFEEATGGEEVSFMLEAAANPAAEWHWGEGEHQTCDPEERLFKVKTLRLAIRDEEVFQLLIDFQVCKEAMFELPEDSTRRARLRRGLDEACRMMDTDNSEWVALARARLAPLLACRNGSSSHKITATGHAHIDTAWCWPLRETIRKCSRTFATALAYMEKHPDYRFSSSQPVQYLWMKEYYPSIYQGIREAVKRGQWEVIGSMWVEPDCNIPSGESLVRQVLHGKRFFEEEFGIETKDLWLPDVFGYSAALPQILRKSGIDWFLTQKISWNDTTRFPHHSFDWEGLDGTRIFSHFPPVDTYTGRLTGTELKRAERQFAEKDRASHSLLPFGQGDGGGGPTLEMIERARRFRDFEGMPQVEMGTVNGFFEKASEELTDRAVWRGELYLQLHRGTYTSQAYNKWMNRHCEQLLRDAEFYEVIADQISPGELLDAEPCPQRTVWDVDGHSPEKDGSTTAKAMDRAWKLLLLNQFHDILPGSSIAWVYEDSCRDYRVIEEIGRTVRDAALARIAGRASGDHTVVFNSLAHSRREVVELPSGSLALAEVPSCGYARISGETLEKIAVVTADLSEDGITLSNDRVRAVISNDGKLTSLVELKSGREMLSEPGNEFHLLRDHPNRWNSWDIEGSAMEDFEVVGEAASVNLVECTDLRAIVEIRAGFGDSSIHQTVVLRAGSARLDFKTTLDWQERHRVLKVSFPLAIQTDHVGCEVQHGYVRRPIHRNTNWDAARFEICAHGWADLSDEEQGVALLNDGRFGHDVLGSRLRLTLAKAGHAPDPEADRGEHQFTYSLFCHSGTPAAGGVIEAAAELNAPLQLRQSTLDGAYSWLSFDRPGVRLESLKRREDGEGYVIRLNESRGGVRTAAPALGLPLRIGRELDLLERPLEGACSVDALELRAFDLRTFELKPLE